MMYENHLNEINNRKSITRYIFCTYTKEITDMYITIYCKTVNTYRNCKYKKKIEFLLNFRVIHI